MKKILAWTLLFVLIAAHSAQAAPAVPPKGTPIRDEAGMFPAAQLQDVAETAASKPYSFYILTVPSLEGANPGDFAEQVYKSWGLKANEILLLLSKQERRVEVHFKNPALQQKLDALPNDYDKDGSTGESKLDEFVTVHFIPLAKAGDYAQASVTLMKETEKLALAKAEPAAPSPSPMPENRKPSNAVPGPAVSTAAPAAPATPAAPAAPRISGVRAGAFFLLLLLAGYIGFALILRRRAGRLKREADGVLVELSRTREALNPYIGLSQGTTAEISTRLEKMLSALLTETDDLTRRCDEQQAFTLRLWNRREQCNALSDELAAIRERSAACGSETDQIVQADRNVKRLTTEAGSLLIKLVSELGRTSDETGYPLTALRNDADSLSQRAKQADSLRIFDPVEAEKEALQLHDRLEQFQQDLSGVYPYRDKALGFGEAAAAARARIGLLIQEHHLGKASDRLKPYETLELARKTMDSLQEHLAEGHIAKVIQESNEADGLLADAVGMMERQVRLKEENTQDIQWIRGKADSLSREKAGLASLLGRIRDTYTSNHWEPVESALHRIDVQIRDALTALPRIEELCSDARQEYDAGRAALDPLLSGLQEAEKQAELCSRECRALDERLAALRESAGRMDELAADTAALIRREALPAEAEWERRESFLHSDGKRLKELLTVTPHNLEDAERLLNDYRSEVTEWNDAVRYKAELKREAERQYREAMSRYRSAASRSHPRMRTGFAESRFDSSSDEIGRLMALGMYAEAVREISNMNELADRMEHEYRQAMEAEEAERRRQEQANQAQTDTGSSAGGGSWDSSSSSGTDSSGSSGSGSSGGDNW